jgi:hypothetical protein
MENPHNSSQSRRTPWSSCRMRAETAGQSPISRLRVKAVTACPNRREYQNNKKSGKDFFANCGNFAISPKQKFSVKNINQNVLDYNFCHEIEYNNY